MILFVLIKEDTTDFNCRKGEVADTAQVCGLSPSMWERAYSCCIS